MRCPFCEHPVSRVLQTRAVKEDEYSIRRRRECCACGTRWTTLEDINGNVREGTRKKAKTNHYG